MFSIFFHPSDLTTLSTKTAFLPEALHTEAETNINFKESHHKGSCTDSFGACCLCGPLENPMIPPDTFKLQKMFQAQCLRIQCLEVFSTVYPLDSEIDLQSSSTPLFSQENLYHIPDCSHLIALT